MIEPTNDSNLKVLVFENGYANKRLFKIFKTVGAPVRQDEGDKAIV